MTVFKKVLMDSLLFEKLRFEKLIFSIVLTGLFIIPVLGQTPPENKHWEVVFQDKFNILTNSRWSIRNNFDHYGELQVWCL